MRSPDGSQKLAGLLVGAGAAPGARETEDERALRRVERGSRGVGPVGPTATPGPPGTPPRRKGAAKRLASKGRYSGIFEGYETVQRAAQRYGMDESQVRRLCAAGRISGAAKFGRNWAIPRDSWPHWTGFGRLPGWFRGLSDEELDAYGDKAAFQNHGEREMVKEEWRRRNREYMVALQEERERRADRLNGRG